MYFLYRSNLLIAGLYLEEFTFFIKNIYIEIFLINIVKMEEKKRWFSSFFKSEQKQEEKPKKAEDIIKDSSADSECGPDGCNLIVESMQSNIEANYYWFLNFLKSTNTFGLNFKEILKINDVYSAGEASSLWGSQEQRKGIQQDKVSQYMATIGKLIKDTFQIIRELRIIDERLEYYQGYNKGSRDASTALKGIWIDLVEGGTKNPASVFGLASQVGFATLPDLFFLINPKDKNSIVQEVNKLKGQGINRKVREVLERKLFQFLVWKEKTEKEIRDRKNFILKYLRMHTNNIKLYINWVKPYLKSVKQLQSASTAERPYVGSTFETSQIELEIMAVGDKYEWVTEEGYEETFEFNKYFPCIIVKLNHIAMPQMAFQREYQRGPIHTGRTEINIKAYVLEREQIEQYKAAKEKESYEEIADLVPSLKDSLDAIGDELQKYLKEAGELVGEKEPKPKKGQGTVFTPFTSIFKGIKGIFSSGKSKKPLTPKKESIEKDAAKNIAKAKSYVLYDVFKKTHGMLAP